MDRLILAEVGRVSEEKRQRKNIREENRSEERRCIWGKGRKVVDHFCFKFLVGPEGREPGSLKRQVWSHLTR